ncbi:MAG TPA: thioredoxin family protein [Ignavibacteriaceae bacterium]|nr:thioredoxin family protein [Ignavibacteriaceae bacterium]
MSRTNLLKTISETGISYADYKSILMQQVQNYNDESATQEEKKQIQNRKLNLQRTNRLDKYFHPSEKSIQIFQHFKIKQIWMVLSETWCGDSAQNLPIISALANLSNYIELKILFRDEHPEIMNLYLEGGGKRSIPKLVSFNENGDELFQWGPRPQQAKLLFDKMVSDGIDKDERSKTLHLWYGRDRGLSVENELVNLIEIFLKTIVRS